jgi:anaerobic sulfite reductase subunit B
MNLYESKKYRVLKTHKQTHENFFIRVKCNLNPEPGQFLEISIPGIGEAPVSTCSYNNKILDMNVTKVGNVTNALSKIKKGDSLLIRGPYGKPYPMHLFKNNSLVIIGGGCGVAPLRGVIEYVEKFRKDYKDVHLFLGFRTPEDILFKKEIKNWEKKYDMEVSVDENPLESSTTCKIGFVTKLVEDSKIDNKEKIAIVCGPPIMIKIGVGILKKKGFNNDQIFVSYERHMKCGAGMCGHCMVHGKYVCKDGPVFRYDEVKNIDE